MVRKCSHSSAFGSIDANNRLITATKRCVLHSKHMLCVVMSLLDSPLVGYERSTALSHDDLFASTRVLRRSSRKYCFLSVAAAVVVCGVASAQRRRVRVTLMDVVSSAFVHVARHPSLKLRVITKRYHPFHTF